jgi:soluble lytic murein transglycosylase
MRFSAALILFFYTAVGVAAPTAAYSPDSKPQWVQEWKDIKILSRQDRLQACDRLQNLKWADDFPFPNIIEEKKSLYCRKPPAIIVNDFYSLMKASQFYRLDFDIKTAQKYLTRAFKKAKTQKQKIVYWDEQMKLDRSNQDKTKRLRSALKLKQLDPDKYLVDYARMLWTYDQTNKAIQTLNQAPKLFRKSTSQQEVLFVLGRIQEEKGQVVRALSYYDKALKEPPVSTDVLAKVLSFAAWVNYKLGEYSLSAGYWQQLYDKSFERFSKSRALYWIAICQKQSKSVKDKTLFKQTLSQLIDEDPTSYYAVLAMRDLQKPFTPLKPFEEDSNAADKIVFFDEDEKRLLKWLTAFDEKEMAEILLLNGWPEAVKASETQQTAYFQYFWKLGLTNALTRSLNQLDDATRLKLTQKYQAALFPYHFEDEIKLASKEESLDPYFVMALIRQESAFNPEARSPTDALGLMQVMPSLAKRIAKDKKLKYSVTTELFNPLLNVRIGTRELNERLDEFNESSIMASASYNAGVEVTKSWLKTRYQADPVEFIEVIPYEETRSYVRLILRNEIFYRRLFSKETFMFPEETLTQGWEKR